MMLKDSTKKIFISVISIVIIGILFFVAENIYGKTNLYVQKISKITQSVKEESESTKIHSVNIIMNELNKNNGENIGGSKIKITYSSQINVALYNISSNSEISPDENGAFEIPQDGVNLRANRIEDGKSYDIQIESVELERDYVSTFKTATISIDARNNGLVSYVKEIVKDVDEEEVVVQGSEEDTVVFMYETDENSNIKIAENEDLELYYTISSLNQELSEEELGSADWIRYNKENGITLEKNGIVYAKSKYKTGEYSEVSKIYVTNIDKIAPEIDVTTKTEKEEGETSFSARIKEERTNDYGASGIVAYALTQSNTEPENFTECENSLNIEEEFYVTKNGTYYLWAKDEAGNVGKKEFKITNLKVNVVAIILSSPYEDLNGTEYESITSLLDTLKTYERDTDEKSKVIAQIVRDIPNETVSFDEEKHDIVIDLNGYTINSEEENIPTFELSKGSLQIVDNKYKVGDYITKTDVKTYLENTYSEKTGSNGKISSKQNIAIKVQQNSTLTLGEDDANISIEIPEVSGKTIGVVNQGNFNFYDGIIKGQTAIDGNVTDTPVLYDPTVTTEEEIQAATLAKVAGIEALIGKTRYTKLEQAIDAANRTQGNSQTEVEIDVVAELNKTQTITIDNTKNIVLDLNGYPITVKRNTILFKNNGKLRIKDSTVKEGTKTENVKALSCVENDIVDTGATLAGNYKIETKFKINGVYNNNYLWGTGNSNFECFVSKTDNLLTFKTNNQEIKTTKEILPGQVYNVTIEYKNRKALISIDGEVDAEMDNIAPATASNSLKLFANSDNTCKSNLTMYDFKLYMQDELALDLEPVKAGDSIDNQELTAEYNGFYNKNDTTFKYGQNLVYSQENIIEGISEGTGKIEGADVCVISNIENGQFVLDSGTLKVDSSSDIQVIVNWNASSTQINGGKIIANTSEGSGICSIGTGNIEINGGRIIAPTGIELFYFSPSLGANCTVTMNGGVIESSRYGINNYSKSTVIINGGNVYTTGEYGYAVENSQGILNINGGKIYGTLRAISNSGTVNINDGIIVTLSGETIFNYISGNLNINGGYIATVDYAPYLIQNSGNITITGGKLIGNRAGIITINTLTVTNGYLEALAGKAIVNTSNITIENGTIKASSTAIDSNGGEVTLGNEATSIPEILGGTYGLYVSGGKVNILNASITSKSNPAIISENSAEVKIGIKDGRVNNTIKIKSKEDIGLYNKDNGNVYIYDGIIEGKDCAILSAVKEIESNTNLKISKQDSIETAELERYEEIAKIGDTLYDDLQTAVNDCDNEERTITILKDFAITGSEQIQIDSNKKIIIDLNGKKITTFSDTEAIVNNGELKVIDSLANGAMQTRGCGILRNNNEMHILATLKNDGIKETSGESNIIVNSKHLKFEGNISTTLGQINGIRNIENGTINYISGTISTSGNKSYAIINESNEDMTLNFSEGSISGIKNASNSTVEIQNGNIVSSADSGNAILNTTSGNIVIKGGNISSSGTGITNEADGTITIEGGVLSAQNSTAIYNKTNGTVTITNGTINASTCIENVTQGIVTIANGNLTGKSYVINNKNNGNVTIENGQLICDDSTRGSSTINNQDSGTVTILGGTITNNASEGTGIYNVSTTSKIVLGVKDGSSRNTPYINGLQYGIYNSGTLEFYDGIIEGNIDKSVYGIANETEDGFQVRTYKTGDTTEYEIVEGREIKVLKQNPVVELSSTGIQFGSINLALENAAQTDTLVMLTDITIGQSIASISIPQNKDISLDLAGYTVTATNENTFINNGKFTLIDNSLDKTGKLITTNGKLIINQVNGIVDLGETEIEAQVSGSSNEYKKAIINEGTLNINKTKITSTGSYVQCINNKSSGNVIVTDFNIVSEKSNVIGIYNEDTGKVWMKNGTVNLTGSSTIGISNNNNGEFKIDNGNILVSSSAIQAYESSKNIINNGKMSGSEVIKLNNNSDLVVNNAEEINGYNGINVYDEATMTINDGRIITSGYRAVQLKGTGDITINGGTISAIGGYNSAICNEGKSTVTINGGTIESSANTITNEGAGTLIIKNARITTTGQNSYAIADLTVNSLFYGATVDHGTIIIGDENGETPGDIEIISENYIGIFNGYRNNLYIYDGAIKGKKYSIMGIVSSCKEGKRLELKTEDGLEVAELKSINTDEIVQVDGINYTTLSGAIAACGENEKEIKVLKDFTLVDNEKNYILNKQNIKLDLNGKIITIFAGTWENYYNAGRTYAGRSSITVLDEGILTIKDSSENGKIISRGYGIIENRGETYLESGEMIQVLPGKNSRPTVTPYMITNYGILTLTGTTTISSTEKYVYGIYNSYNDNCFDMDGGYLHFTDSTSTAVYNEGNEEMNMTGGLIETEGVGILNTQSSGVTIAGGEIRSNSIAIKNETSSLIAIQSGTIVSKETAINNNGGAVGVIGGTVTSTNSSGISGSGTFIIYGGEINAISSDGINAQSGKVTIMGGNITANTAIRGTSSLEVTLGKNDGEISTTIPEIKGTSYGIVSSKIYFYDGVVTGGEKAITGTIVETPENYIVKYEDDQKKATLELDATFDNTIELNEIYYQSLQSAIDAIQGMTEKTGIIKINGDIQLEIPIIIPQNTNVTLVLQGHNITYTSPDVAITNNGTLTVIDYLDSDDTSTEGSVIENLAGTVIHNNSNVIIGKEGSENNTRPLIVGITAISGNDYIRYSGQVMSLGMPPPPSEDFMETGKAKMKTIQTKTIKALNDIRLSAENVIESYRYALSEKPSIEHTPKTWTNKNVEVSLAANITPVLNLYVEELQDAKVTVQYIYKNNETEEVLYEEPIEGKVGDTYTANAKNFEGYVLVERPENETVTMTGEEIVLKYYYAKVSNGVLEKHIDKISGDILYNKSHTGNVGDSYNIEPREFEGYDLVEDELPTNAAGTMTGELTEVVYYYIYKTKVNVKYIYIINEETGETIEVAESEVIPGHEGDEYTTQAKKVPGYELIVTKLPENATGEMTKEDITVTYYYAKISEGRYII